MTNERKHKRKPKRAQSLEDIPLTPMIDVVFQLLIYFVWTFAVPDQLSQMHVYRPMGILEASPLSNTRVEIHEGERYTFNDSPVTRETLRSLLQNTAIANPEQNIIVIATANSRHEHLVWALNTLHDVGLKNVVLLSSD